MTAFFDLPVRRIAANGIEIAARVDGAGPPLLLLH
jgi:haloacetate dehalogenase